MLRNKLIKIGAKVVRHGRYITFQLAEVANPEKPVRQHPATDRRPAAGSFAAMTGSDSEASGPPDRGATPRECRGVPSHHEMGGATAVQSKEPADKPRRLSCAMRSGIGRLQPRGVLPFSVVGRYHPGNRGWY